MTITEIREYFPYLNSGMIYFNHAACGPLSTFVLDRINSYLHELSVTKIENYDTFLEHEKSAKKKLAQLLNAEAKNFAWCENVSSALNILANGIIWKPGDRILLNDIEFPSNIYPFLNMKKYGVEIDFAKSENGKVNLEHLEKYVTPKTKLISISFVQFLSGYRADLEMIGEFCRNKNIIFCVDAIQGAGVSEIDITRCKIDFLTGGTHKWLMSMQGNSYFYVSDRLLEILQSAFVGWISVKDAWNLLDYNLELKDDATRFQYGTMNSLGVVAFDASLDFFNMCGKKFVEERVLENSNYMLNLLNESGFDTVLKNANNNEIAGIISVRTENEKRLFLQLESKNIKCSLRENIIRFSPTFYNTFEEIDIVVTELKSLFKK